MFDRVSLTWRSRNLLPNEKFQVKLVRNRDGLDWNFDTSDFTLPFVFDTSPAIFEQPGDFHWSVRIVNTTTNKAGGYSLERWFKFERRPDEEPTATRVDRDG